MNMNTNPRLAGIFALADKLNSDGIHIEENSELCHYFFHRNLAAYCVWNSTEQRRKH